MSAPVEFVGKRSKVWFFGAILGVLTFGAIVIAIPFDSGFSWGAELFFAAGLVVCLVWLGYLIWMPTMRLSVSPDTVVCTSKLMPARFERTATGDVLEFQKVRVSNGRNASMTWWKVSPPGAKKGVLLMQWDPDQVAEACKANGWRVEWHDLDGALLDGRA